MASASRTFRLATKASVDEKREVYESIAYDFEDPDAEKPKGQKSPVVRTLIAHHPGEGALIVMAASIGMTDDELANPAGALFTFLRATFTEQGDYEYLRSQVSKSRLDLREDVMAMVSDMMESWSGVPTQQ